MSASQSHAVKPLNSLLDAIVRVPGSKSVAARALICAALSTGTSTVSNLPSGDDTESMLAGLMLGWRERLLVFSPRFQPCAQVKW